MICLTPFGVIFLPVAKVILRLRRSDILFASSTAARQYHSAESRISLRSNRTRRKANRTEKSTCYCKCFFLGGSGWTRALFGVRLLRKPPIYRLVVLIHPFLHKNNQPQKRLGYLVIYLTLFGVIFLLSQKWYCDFVAVIFYSPSTLAKRISLGWKPYITA